MPFDTKMCQTRAEVQASGREAKPLCSLVPRLEDTQLWVGHDQRQEP